MRVVPGPTDRVVIVGAGLAGLAAALHLAGAGRAVTVLEREPGPGGRCGMFVRGGFRFDTGPTVLTMPELIDSAFAAVGERLSDRVDLMPVRPLYRARFADGSSLDVHTDPDAMAAEIERLCGPGEVGGYLAFRRFVTQLYEIEMPHFIDRNLDGPFDLVGTPLLRLLALGGFRRLAAKVGHHLTDPRLRRVFSFQAMYAGLAPHSALALYCVISYMDSVAGVFFPRGGMHAVPTAMAAAAQAHGVEIRYGCPVARVDVRGSQASGVITWAGEHIRADAVVVTADLPVACRQLLPPHAAPARLRRLRRLRYSPSCFLLLAGSTAAYPRDAHHTITFGSAWEQTFHELIDAGSLMSDPSFLVTCPTRSDPTLAPDGRHSYYALFPTPNTDAGLDWSVLGPRYRDEVIETLHRRGYPGFGAGIEVEHTVTPHDWQRMGLDRGTPFAAAHTFGQTGPFRPGNLVPGLDNVVFAGSGTVPGVGVPMVAISGRLAARRITG